MRFLALLLLASVPVLPLPAAEIPARPALAFSKSFGGTGNDAGTAIATDADGNIYVAGTTTSRDFPVKNALQAKFGGANFRASLDNGGAWASIAIPEGVYAVAGTAKAPGVLYAGTASTIYKSTDEGKTWTLLQGIPTATVNAILIDPANPNVVYAGTSQGLFKSQDAGATWDQSFSLVWNTIGLVANPSRPATLFACIAVYPTYQWFTGERDTPDPSLYRSTDSGLNWSPLAGPPDPVIALTIDPSNPDVLYASANPGSFEPNDPTKTSIYKTVDAGNT